MAASDALPAGSQSRKETYTVTPTPYPTPSQTETTTISGVETTATRIDFAEKIMVMISQEGRLAHWVHVPLDISATDYTHNHTSTPHLLSEDEDVPPSDLLPMHHLTATTILGGTIAEVNVLGQTLATQIGSAVLTRDASEKRMLVVGMGLDKGMSGREAFGEIVGLVLSIL